MRWSYRMRPCLSGIRTTHRNARIAPTNYASTQSLLFKPALRLNTRGFSNTASQHRDHEKGDPPSRPPRRRRPPPLLLILLAGSGILGAAALWLLSGQAGARGSEHDDVLNRSTFSAFTIVSREEVSPTAFVLKLRSSNGRDNAASPCIRDAWRHGLWSVEVKQPQLQIARHYTPLPASPQSGEAAAVGDYDGGAEIRLLVRRVHGGEMSSYLSRLEPGDAVWLRGTHLGFDVPRRLGLDGRGGGDGGGSRRRRDVVFLAAGTGIAPALQVAQRLLLPPAEDYEAQAQSMESALTPPPSPDVNITILWANRRAVDALGREPRGRGRAGVGGWFLSWFGMGNGSSSHNDDGTTAAAAGPLETSSLERQIRDLQTAFPGRFRVRHFVDEEGTFIGARDVASAISSCPQQQPVPAAAKQCPWHSPAALEGLPDDDDAGRRGVDDGRRYPCLCANDGATAPGSNLLFVSGPDGFIEALAGPKRWHAGGEMQGPVRGVLGRLAEGGRRGGGGGGELLDGWLVLKL